MMTMRRTFAELPFFTNFSRHLESERTLYRSKLSGAEPQFLSSECGRGGLLLSINAVLFFLCGMVWRKCITLLLKPNELTLRSFGLHFAVFTAVFFRLILN